MADTGEADVGKMFRLTRVDSIEALLRLFEELGNYVFRGQAVSDWGLMTTFERVACAVPPENWRMLEQKVILEFRRRAHHYLSHLPRKRQHLEWLALMQHHGAPTPLLDFTRSFFVALFFAVEDSRSDSALWAVNVAYHERRSGSIREPGIAFSEADVNLHSSYSRLAEREANDIVCSSEGQPCAGRVLLVEPYRMNERLSIQQGLFLLPTRLDVSFEENLASSHHVNSLAELAQKDGGLAVVKIVIPKELHLQIASLLNTMNISAATLFPGLNGYARSQKIHIQSAELSFQRQDKFMKAILEVDWDAINRASHQEDGK